MRSRTVLAGHRTAPHTADLIVQAWAATGEGCLAEAVAGLVDSCVDTSQAVPTGVHPFRLTAGSVELGLVAVLEEVLYLLDARGEVPIATRVERLTATEVVGSFDVAGISGLPAVGSAPKGISLSGLVLQKEGAGWYCSVTVDV